MGREGRLAEQFPAGLENSKPTNEAGSEKAGAQLRVIDGSKSATQSASLDVLDERSFGKSTRQHVREFGAVMALVGAVVGAFMVRHPERLSMGFTIAGIGMGVYLLGLVAPRSLVPVWQGWMKFAHYLGLVVTGILLVSMWVGIVVPIGVLVRLLKVKIMDMRFRAPVSTYWEERDPALHDFKLLERQW